MTRSSPASLAARLPDGLEDGVARLGRGQDGLELGEALGGFEYVGLQDGHGFEQAVCLELGEDGAHAVVAQASGVIGAGDEAVAEGVHLRERAGLARIGEVVGEAAAREAGAAGGLDGHEARAGMGAEDLIAHEGRDEAAQV